MSAVAKAARRDPVARALHWTMAALLLVQAALGLAAGRASGRGAAAWLMDLHVQLGLALFLLLGLRLARRFARPPAPPPPAARAVHALLYALMLAMPLSGYVLYAWEPAVALAGGAWTLPAPFVAAQPDDARRAGAWTLHVYGAWALGLGVLGHAAAAGWHRWRRRGAY